MFANLRFTDEEKDAALPMAIKMVNLGVATRANGIMSLEEITADEIDFIRIGANLLLEGQGPVMVERVLQNYILAGNYEGVDLLERLIITQGMAVMAEVSFHGWFVSAHIVGSMLGEAYVTKIIDAVGNAIDCDEFISKHNTPLTESKPFETKLLSLTSFALSKFLVFTDSSVLAPALKGCSRPFIDKIKLYMSTASFASICELLSVMHLDQQSILEYQRHVLNDLDRMMNNYPYSLYST